MKALMPLVSIAALLGMPAVGVAQDTEIQSKTKHVTYLNDQSLTTTSSETDAPLPGLTTSINTKSGDAIFATFCGESQIEGGAVVISVELNGKLMPPGAVILNSSNDLHTSCHIWASNDVTHGRQEIRVLWHSLFAGNTARMNFKTLKLEY